MPFEALLTVPAKIAPMGLDRETIAQVLVSVTAVVLFIAGLVVLSLSFGTTTSEGTVDLSAQGGMFLVAFIALFIVVMPVFGYLIERSDFDS